MTHLSGADVAGRLAIVCALILANGFFVAAEFAIVTVRKTRIDQLVAEGNRLARTVRRAVSDPDRYIAATQLGITMASLALGWVGERYVASMIEPIFAFAPTPIATATVHSLATTVAFALITAVTIVFGELAPKTIALQQAERTALAVAWPTEVFMVIFWPFIRLLNGLGRAVVRLFGLREPSGHSLVHSEEELKMLVTASQEAGVLEEDEEQMLHRVFGFADLTAAQVMIPRTEMVAAAADASLAEVLAEVARLPYPWLPVYRETLDDIAGIVPVADLVRAVATASDRFALAPVVRDAVTVPETMKADDVLNEMRRKRMNVVVVIDEYGSTAGLVTFEGMMERIVGDVTSEFGPAGSRIRVLHDGSALVDGLVLVADVNDRFGLHLDEATYTTVGGYVLGRLGRRARVGDAIDVEGRTMRVEALDGLRVARILVTPPTRRSVAPQEP
ncbi:MAG: hemolysin family protein [Bacteroidales bacterium]